jgi:23S rRNA (guanosine2251-2'-O)-methyltransferase
VIVYGRNAVRELLRGPRTAERVWATKNAAREPWLTRVDVELADGAGPLEALCGSPDHQGVCAEASPYRYAAPDEVLAAPAPLVVALDEVQDPQNLGAICRTAECAGAAGVVLPERRSAEVTPAVCKASAGAVEHLRIARVRNLADFLGEAKSAGLWCYGAAAGAPATPAGTDLTGGVVLVFGSEGRGLRPRVAASCDALLALPLQGRIESLNVGAAAAAVLFEAVRQRTLAPGA